MTMWVLATWPPMAITSEPNADAVETAIRALDNETRLGLALFRERDDPPESERSVVMGGKRLNVQYWPAGAEAPTFYLQDDRADKHAQTLVNFGDQGTLAYPMSETVTQDIAVAEILYFMKHGKISAYGAWSPYDSL